MDKIKLRITVMAVLAVFLLKGTDTFAQQTDPTLTGAVFAQTSTLKNIYDKRQKAHEKIIAADVLVLASPVYFYTIDAQMKTLIDRCVARYTEIVNKELYYIITAADTSLVRMERTVECFRGFADCLDGAVEKGVVYGVGAWKSGDIRQTAAFQAAWDMGKNI